jgi:hypothetical protein
MSDKAATKQFGSVKMSVKAASLVNLGLVLTYQRVIGGHQDVKFKELGSMLFVFVVPFVLSHHIAPNTLTVMINAANHVGPAFELSSPVFYR